MSIRCLHQVGATPHPTLHIGFGHTGLERQNILGDVWLELDSPIVGPVRGRSPARQRDARRAFWGATADEGGFDALTRPMLRGRREVVIWSAQDARDALLFLRTVAEFHAMFPSDGPALWWASRPSPRTFHEARAQFAAAQQGRRPVGARVRRTALALWRAWCGTPREIERAATHPHALVPGASAMFRRRLHELPSTQNGLGRLERRLLRPLLGAPDTAGSCIGEALMAEPKVFGMWMGDLLLDRALTTFASCAEPLVRELRPAPAGKQPGARTLCLTPFGRRVLAGRADHAQVNGVDHWIGGTHVVGTRPRWRYDVARQRVVEDGH